MKKILLIIIVLLISNSFSQDISQLRVVGKAESMSGELIDKSIRDANGDICAGLIIVSDLPGLTFQSSNGIVKINSKPGNDFLFLSPDERVVTVYCTGYEPLKIILSEVSVRLRSGEVWQIKITGDKKIDAIPVNILVNQDAELFIDGISKGKVKTLDLSPGKYQLRIQKEGYKTVDEEITVSRSSNLFNYQLKAIDPEIIEIRSEPKGALIYIDGVAEGQTDNQVFRFAGKYKLRLTLSGYLDIEKEIEVKENSDNKFNYNLVKNISTILLTTDPIDAEVEINNKIYGTQRNIELAPGTYLIVVKKNGYREKRETIKIELEKTENRTISLEAIKGNLQVKVAPIDAEVRLIRDGKEIERWKGAKIKRDILIGNYKIEAAFQGYERITKSILIRENETTQEEIILTKSVNNLSDNINNKTIFSSCGTAITYKGKTYNTVQIGKQCWFKENLDVGAMVNGKESQSDNDKIEKYCYQNLESNCNKYGGLYQWNEAMQYVTNEGAQGICPEGWHIPTEADFEILGATVNNDGNSLKIFGRENNSNGNTDADTYADGFSALFTGGRFGNGSFKYSGSKSYFWSSTEEYATLADYLHLSSSDSRIDLSTNYGENGFSIRCIKN